MNNKMENLRNFLKDFIAVVRWEICIPKDADWKLQAFSTRNIVGDIMENVYAENGAYVDYCRGNDYIEIFGLTEEEYNSLSDLLDIY